MKYTKLLLCGAMLSCLFAVQTLHAEFTEVSIPGDTQRPQDIVYFNNLFIAVGYDAEIMTSPDGMTWTLQDVKAEPVNPDMPEFLPAFRGVAASDTMVVAVGDRGIVATSQNGTDWTVTRQADQSLPGFQGIAFGEKKFVAANFGQTVSVSTDGLKWEDFSVNNGNAAGSLQGIVYTGEEFVAVFQTGDTSFTSIDGETWTSFNSSLSSFLFIQTLDFAGDAVYAGGRVSGGSGLAYADEEGPFSFAQVESPSAQAFISGVAGGAGKVAAVGGVFGQPGESYLYVSDDGENFSLSQPDLSSVSNGIIYANGLWIIIGEGFAAYSDTLPAGGGAPGLPYLVEGATSFGGDWYDTWIGVLNVEAWPWYYGEQGWVYAGAEGNTNSSSWFYFLIAELNTWVWASDDIDDWVYCQPTGKPEGWWFVDDESTPGFVYLLLGDEVVTLEDVF